MASRSRTPAVANSPLVTMEAKMIVATGHDHCQQLKHMLSEEDSSSMVVVMASSNQTSTSTLPKPPSSAVNYQLLASACSGSFQDMKLLLNGEGRSASGNRSTRSSADDEEAFLRESLLDGVTVGGDTVLHVVAGADNNGDGDDILKKARLIHGKAGDLLFAQNINGDTPLHCAARAANVQMVSLLIDLAECQDNSTNRVEELLGTENKSKETALHEAVRVGSNDIVELLMKKDPELARFPNDGTSPMYLAILLKNKVIAETLHKESGGVLSYSGPNGQNALHAAVLRGKGLTNMLLTWNKDLTIQRDEKGNTPLHYAASVRHIDQEIVLKSLLQANQETLYLPDHDGSFPIHVAASVDNRWAISHFIKISSSCAGLRDGKGRTFLHLAADKKPFRTVKYACKHRNGNRLSWIMNTQDNDGNTALHLVVHARSLSAFCSMLGSRHVNLNLTNEKGETPRDIAHYTIRKDRFSYYQSREAMIYSAIRECGGTRGICRHDCFDENDIYQARQDEMRQMALVKDTTQNLCIVSVLIATVTFGATFAMPGGYRADDHTNGGTPTLAGRYAFDAFTLANALAFTFSVMATISLMYSGTPIEHLRARRVHLGMAFYCMSISIKCLVAAFAIGSYMMLAPVAHKTAIGVCVLSSLVLLYENLDPIMKHVLLIAPFCVRKGKIYTILWFGFFILFNSLLEYWPLIVIFCSTARNYPAGKVEPAV